MGFWSSLQGTISSFFQRIGDTLKAAYEKAKEFVKYVYEKCKAALLWVWRQVSRFFCFVGELVSDMLKSILNAIKHVPSLSKRLRDYLYANAYKVAELMSAMFKCKFEMCDLVISILQTVNNYGGIPGATGIVTDVINFF